MSDVFSISEVALINGMDRMNAISQNIANSNTYGYKSKILFTKVLDEQAQNMQGSSANSSNPGEGGFSSLQHIPHISTVPDFSPGVVKSTSNPLDIAIQGKGFFVFDTNDGVKYGRNGTFKLNAMGRLVNSSGYEVQGLSGSIRLQTENVRIDKSGIIYEGDESVGQLKLVNINHSERLLSVGENLYQQGDARIQQMHEEVNVRQGFLEASNVNEMKSMTDMMSTLRQIEITQRVIKGYDDVLGTAIDSLVDF